MKVSRSYILLFLLASAFVFSSCKKDLEKLNENPNRPEVVDPEYLLNSSIFNTMNLFGGAMRREVFSHYSNYVSVGGGQLQRYGNFPSSNNGYWRTAYVSCLQPLHQIQVNFGSNSVYKNRVAIAKVLECYIYSEIVA